MNEKKKLLSLFLCLVLLFSTLSTTLVSADSFNPEVVAEVYGDDTVNITTEYDEEVYIRFSPDVSGWYAVYSDDYSEADPYAYLYDTYGDWLDEADDERGNDNFLFHFYFEAYEDYYFGIRDYDYEGGYSFDVIFEEVDEDYTYIGKIFESGNLTYEVIGDGELSVWGYARGFETPTDLANFTLEIPAEVNGMKVTNIDSEAFYNGDFVSVTIPETVTSIGSWAFAWCENLETVTIPKNVSYLSGSAFYYCSSLQSINVDSKNENYASEDGVLFDKEKTVLMQYPAGKTATTYTIPSSVTEIGENAFFGNHNLTTVTIPNTVTYIGDYAFRYCAGLTSITIPGSINSIVYGTFEECYSLKSVTIGEGVTDIDGSAFAYCESLENITIPKSVTSIGYDVFYDTAYYNNEANWENDVLYIGDCLIEANDGYWDWTYDEENDWYDEFYVPGISGSYAVKDGTRLIADYAFDSCEDLEKVTIPKSVTNIGCDAFYDTGYYNNEANWENDVLYIGDCLIEADDGYYDEWYDEENDEYHEEYVPGISGSYDIKAGTRVIADYAFSYCEDLEKVTIPSSVTNIGKFAFADCYSMQKITVLNCNAVIGGGAFNCYSDYFVLYGYADSTAQKFAEENDIKFIALQHTHNYTEVVTKQPTCTQAGSKICTCECMDSYVAEVPALGHKEETIAGKAATCTETGLTEGKKCTVCGVVTVAQKEIPALGHKEEVIAAKAATCTEAGLTEGKKCATCGVVIVAQTTVPALGHKEEVIVAKAATCTETGLTEGKKCTVCGVVTVAQTETAAIGHTLTVVNSKSATYFAKGYTGDSKCARCGVVVTKGKATDKLKLKVPKFKVIKGKKQFKVKYTKVAGATGFEVRYKLKGKWITKTFKTKKTATKAIKKLKKGTYKVQVRAFAKKGKNKAFSAWSKTSKVKVK